MYEYDQDFYLWMQWQAKLLRERRFSEVDLSNLIEEVESMARQLSRELEDRMADVVRLRLLLHLLPDERWATYWRETIRRQRYMNGLILQDSPGLKDRLPEMLAGALEAGRLRMLEELAYAFPDSRFDEALVSMPLLTTEDLFEDLSG